MSGDDMWTEHDAYDDRAAWEAHERVDARKVFYQGLADRHALRVQALLWAFPWAWIAGIALTGSYGLPLLVCALALLVGLWVANCALSAAVADGAGWRTTTLNTLRDGAVGVLSDLADAAGCGLHAIADLLEGLRR